MYLNHAIALVGFALVGCNLQFQSHSGAYASHGGGTGGPSSPAPAGASPSSPAPARAYASHGGGTGGPSSPAPADFPVTLDAPTVELLSEWNESPGTKGEDICTWKRTYASKAHLGGGKYGLAKVPTSTLWASSMNEIWIGRVDPTGPCSRLARGAKSDRDVLVTAQKQHGAKTIRAAHWLADDWTVINSNAGNPIEMDRTAEVLTMIRPAGPVPDAPIPESGLLTSRAVAAQVAKACTFPDGAAMARTPCRVESAAVHHVVHFSTNGHDSTVQYELFVDATVNLGGKVGICEMRLFAFDKDHSVKITNEAQCRASAALDISAWGDPRCFTNRCVELTTKSRGAGSQR